MRKIVSFFAFVAIVISFAACSGNDQYDAFFAYWEGEYEATEIVEQIAQNGEVISSVPARTTTITIFRDTYLYVQSYSIGDPFIPGVDPDNHTVRLKAPKRMPTDSDPEEEGEGEEEPEDSGIENVEVDNQYTHIILRNGGVVSVYNGIFYSPKAIRVTKINAATGNEIALLPGKPFEVVLMREDNTDLGTVTCNWTYSTIRKEGDTYTWEAELHQSPNQNTSQFAVFGTFRHTLTMTKKPAQEVK